MPQEKLRFAVLGVGRIGRIHAANLAARIPRAEVVALVDPVPDALAAAAARLGVSRTYADYRQALELPDVDAVAVCTPTDTHYRILLDAADARKHIFCEKPIELEIEKIRDVNRHVAACGVQMMVAFNRRFDPTFAKVHELVRAGKVGVPHLVRITSRDPAPPPESYVRGSGGIFLDMTIHDFDMARFLAGSDVVEVFARAAVLVDPMFERAGDWDTAITMLTFAGGALGAIDNSRKAVYGYDQRVEVFGSQGMVAVSNNTPDTHVLFDSSGAHASLPLYFFMERYTESYLREMQAFVDAVLDGKPVPVTGEDGLAAVRIALAAACSARERRPVKLDEIPA